MLLAALGTRGDLHITGSDGTFSLLDRDAFLLCSDGLWEYVDQTDMCEALRNAATPDAWLDALAAQVRASADANRDNLSAMAVWVVDAQDTQATILQSSHVPA